MNSSLVQYIARHADTYPDKPCIIDQQNAVSYADFWNACVSFSQYLQACGIQDGSMVMVVDNRSSAFFMAAFAIHLAGGVFIPLERNIGDAYLRELLMETRAQYVIASQDIIARLPEDVSGVAFPDITTGSRPENFDINSITFPQPQAISEIIFTTGTTGKSKGVVMSFKGTLAVAENVKYGVKMKPGNIELIPLPLNHAFGLRRSYGNLLNGSTIVLFDKIIFIKKFFETLRKYKVTAISLTPAEASMILELSNEALAEFSGQLDYLQLAGSIIPENLKRRLCSLLPDVRLYNSYGVTEAGVSCYLDFNANQGKPFCIGQPTVNASFFFADDNGKLKAASKDDPGFLVCGGSMVMEYYYNAPELTAQALRDGFIYSTDLAYQGEDGNIYVLGRKDDVINIGGIKVSPAEIEDKALLLSGVIDSACIGVADKIAGQAPKLYLELDADSNLTIQDIRAFLEQRLEKTQIPKFIETIDKIPRNSVNKINYKALRELHGQ